VTDTNEIAACASEGTQSSPPTIGDAFQRGFGTVAQLIKGHATAMPEHKAIVQANREISYRDLDGMLDRIATALRRDGLAKGDVIGIVSATTIQAVMAFLGALRAGCVPAPIAPSSTPDQLRRMIADCGAKRVFVDADVASILLTDPANVVELDELEAWAPATGMPAFNVAIEPGDSFNIIYSSGTTGTPKGIVHTYAMRWSQIVSYAMFGMTDAVMMVSTPLYSNTTLVSLLPTLALGGTAVLLGKFDARRFLELAERERATHAMLVPVQYQRIMADPEFDRFDLSSFRLKTSTSAPFSADLKADIVRRWPGGLLEIYAMTEGGGTCLLPAHDRPDKLHTVGQPAPGNDIRIIDDHGNELPMGAIGEIVGRSGMMMKGYHGRADATDEAAWHDADGNRFIRHGDLGRFDEEGFLTLLGRTKDMIISGGFNIYPPDLESVASEHPAVADIAVVGVPSQAWGETPYAFYVPRNDGIEPAALVAWVNERVGKTQRLSGAEAVPELPRNAIGKVLKRDLRDRFEAA
jgi:acyl-CoA synthetase (AMP-forming)/AMP-acid ligase II